jgi:hypothetical protein
MAEPSLPEIRELRTTLEAEWSALRAIDVKLTAFYYGEHEIEVPEAKVLGMEPEVITAHTGMEVIRRLKGLYGYGEFEVNPAGMGTKPKREAEKLASFLNAVFPCLEDMTQEDTWDLVKEDVLRLARAWTLTLPRFKQYTVDEGFPARTDYESDKAYNTARDEWVKGQKPPISHRHIPASQVMAVLSGDTGVDQGICEYLETGKTIVKLWPKSEIAAQIEIDAKKKAQRYLILCYVDDRWCSYVYLGQQAQGLATSTSGLGGGEILDAWEHKMGVCPLVLHSGQLTSDPRLEYRFHSVLADIMGPAVARDKLWSRQMTQIKVDALSFVTLQSSDEGSLDKKRPAFKLSTDGPTFLWKDEKLSRLEPSAQHPEAENLEQKLTIQMQRLALTDVMRGIGGTDQSGIHYKLMRDAAQSEWTPMGDHLADGRRREGQMVARAIIALGEPVYVRKSTKDGTEQCGATPELVRDRLEDIHMTLNPEFPEDREGDLEAAGKAQAQGLPPTWIYEKLLRESEPEKLMEQALIEEYLLGAGRQALLDQAMVRAQLKRQAQEGMSPLDVMTEMPNLSPGLQGAIQQTVMPPAMPTEPAPVAGMEGQVPMGVPTP